jgi:hypothetical protein
MITSYPFVRFKATNPPIQRIPGFRMFVPIILRRFTEHFEIPRLISLLSVSVTIFGLVISADKALLSHEADRRAAENVIRREARIDLARQGLVATETEIAKWKAAKENHLSNSG